MNAYFALLTILALLILLGCLVIIAWAHTSAAGARSMGRLRLSVENHGLWLAWAIAAIATAGSLYYSEIAHFVPCKLCWFQRIAMYPLSVILLIAAWRRDHGIRIYVTPVVVIGALISIYHYLIERFPSWSGTASCDPTAPCTTVWVWEFGFISIPFMALSGFAAIAVLMYLMPSGHKGGAR